MQWVNSKLCLHARLLPYREVFGCDIYLNSNKRARQQAQPAFKPFEGACCQTLACDFDGRQHANIACVTEQEAMW